MSMDHDPQSDPAVAAEWFPTDPTGLSDAGRSQLLELADGDTLDLRVAPVAKPLGDTTVRMLGYNGSIPGPTVKVHQGSEIIVKVENQGDLATTVHWHGLRLENKYDGVPHETQAPIPVGGEFTYKVQVPDPGLYWYHPTSARTTPRCWACTATSWSSRPSLGIGRWWTASWC
jgi:FtsP/CotA-like multicopper oxidase with cupredoxin domain